MATNNLTPELLARIQAYYAQPTSGSGWSPSMATPYSEGGQVYQQDGGAIYNYDPNKQQAGQDRFNVYNPDGSFSNEGTFKTDDAMQTFLMALAAAGGMQFLPGGAFGGAAGGGGYGALGATEPVASIGATGGMTSAELAAMGAGGSGLGTMAPLATLEGPMSSSLLADSLVPMSVGGGLAGAAGAAGALGGAAKFLGPAATLLGAAAGAKGQDASQTSVKSMDPRMDKLFYEDLAPRVQGLLAKQMAPGAMPGFTDMQTVGRNLLNQPVAGNGFNRFFPGR